MDNLSLLQNFKKSDFYIDPYPHVIIHNALPQDTYEKLKDAAPSNLIPDKSLDNVRGNINFDQLENIPENKIFLDFLNYHNSEKYYEEFVSIFKDELNKSYPNLINSTRSLIKKKQIFSLTSVKFKKENCMKFNSTYSYNTPVKSSSSVRGPHIDHFDKINFGLYYLRLDDDKSEGGDLILYKWKSGYSNFRKKNIIFTEKWDNMFDHVEEVKTLKYKKNTFILALNSIDALHGVSPREKTEHIRQFCYFSIAFNKDLGFATPNLIEKIFFKNISISKKINIVLSSIKFWTNKLIKKFR